MNFAHAEVATLDPTTMRTLCEEYIANNYIDPETSERLGDSSGLAFCGSSDAFEKEKLLL